MGERLDIGEALERFLLQLRANGRSLHALDQFTRHVRLLETWCVAEGRSTVVGDFKIQDVASFVASPLAHLRPDGQEKKQSSMNVLRTSVRCFFGFLYRAGYIERDPSRLIQRARCGTTRSRALTEAQERRLVEVLARGSGRRAGRDRALFMLMLRTGIRLGSALGADVDDLDPEAGEMVLRRAKGGAHHVVFVPSTIVTVVARYIGERRSGPVFVGGADGRLCARHARARFQRVLEDAGVGPHHRGTHVLRYTFATRLYERTRDVLLVQGALGHRSILSTMAYVRGNGSAVREALCGPRVS